MKSLHNLQQAIVLTELILGVLARNEICTFYGLETECRYRIDGVSLSYIRAEIDQCSDPIEVTFTVRNEKPRVDFQHTFNSADTLVSVPRFTTETQLRVQLTQKPDDVINVEADFYVYGLARADFLNDDVKLHGLEDDCPAINTAAQIALGIMGGLVAIAAVLIIILVFIRYKRRQNTAANAENHLVTNAAGPGLSTPAPSLADINEDHVISSNRMTSASCERNSTQRHSANMERNTTISNADRTSKNGHQHNLDVRYSEIVQKESMKISDC